MGNSSVPICRARVCALFLLGAGVALAQNAAPDLEKRLNDLDKIGIVFRDTA